MEEDGSANLPNHPSCRARLKQRNSFALILRQVDLGGDEHRGSSQVTLPDLGSTRQFPPMLQPQSTKEVLFGFKAFALWSRKIRSVHGMKTKTKKKTTKKQGTYSECHRQQVFQMNAPAKHQHHSIFTPTHS